LSAEVISTMNENEVVDHSAELRGESEPLQSPSSPPLFSTDEEDNICSKLSEVEGTSAAENEAVSGFI